MSGDHNMNQKPTFEPPPETMEYIVRYELMGHYVSLGNDIIKREEGKEWCVIFSHDKDEDIREMKRLRKAIKRVLEYYGAFND